MHIGQAVKITADEWTVFGKIGKVVAESHVYGSTRFVVDLDGDLSIFSAAEITPLESLEEALAC